MNTEEVNQEAIRSLAQEVMLKTNLLIETCDSWLSEEEGRKNMKKRFAERRAEKRTEKRKKILTRIFKTLNIKNLTNNNKNFF